MKTKHITASPGPWHADEPDDKLQFIQSANGALIADGYPDWRDCFSLPGPQNMRANITVMARADQMLVMLRRILNNTPELVNTPLWADARKLLKEMSHVEIPEPKKARTTK